MAYPPDKPVMEILSSLSRKCQSPSQVDVSGNRQRLWPGSRKELAACLKLAIAGAAVWLGVPAIMSALHVGGVW